MARSREVEQKRRVKQALRALRRVWRNLDSQGEKLERTLDRLIERKTLVYADELASLVGNWRQVQAVSRTLEKSLADTVSIASY